MAVTVTSVEIVDILSVRVRFTCTASANVRIYNQGRLQEEFTATADGTGEFLVAAATDEYPFIEIIDRDDQNPTPAFPGRFTIAWYDASGALSYTIQEYVGGVWTDRQTIQADGRLSYDWQSRWLEDSTAHQFRVRATGPGGTSTLASFTALMVRHPDAPSVTYTYDAGTGEVTVAAA